MSTITTNVFIPNTHRLDLALELPPDSPTGEVVLTLTVEAKKIGNKPQNRMAELAGKYKGQIWMSDDFDAPLEDFSEYM